VDIVGQPIYNLRSQLRFTRKVIMRGGVMVFDATFNNISVTYIVAVYFVGGGNRNI
jgi:hypothetical protein